MTSTPTMSNQEILAELKSGSLLDQARRILSTAMAEIDTGSQQRRPMTIFEMQNIEYAAVIKIAALLGVELNPGQTLGTPNKAA
jgi:hypothetical protein